MRRKFEPYDSQVIKKELRALPEDDFLSLTEAMKSYSRDAGGGFTITSYGGGLLGITDGGRGQGRGFFFFLAQLDESGRQRLVLVRVYKKESQKAPRRELELAAKRMKEWMN